MTIALTLPRRIPDSYIHLVRRDPDGTDTVTRRDGGFEAYREFHAENLRAAIAELGIQRPVKIRLTHGRRTGGCHRIRNNSHFITLSCHFAADVMSSDLWHELKHAAQHDELGDADFWKRYTAANRMFGYTRNPYEREAREASRRAEELPLVVVVMPA